MSYNWHLLSHQRKREGITLQGTFPWSWTLNSSAELWSLEEASVFAGYSQVMVTVGIGLSLRLVSKQGCLSRRTQWLLAPVSWVLRLTVSRWLATWAQATALLSLILINQDPLCKSMWQWLGSQLWFWYASNWAFSYWVEPWASALYSRNLEFSVNYGGRKDDAKVEGRAGAWRNRQKEGPFIPWHLQSRLREWNASLVSVVIVTCQHLLGWALLSCTFSQSHRWQFGCSWILFDSLSRKILTPLIK